MSTTTEEPTATKAPAKRKVASKPKEGKPPRIPPFVNGDPFTEKTRVPLTREQLEEKTDLMLEMLREQSVLNSEYEAAKADFKARIKGKAEDIAKVQSIMAAKADEQEVAVYFRYWPKRKIKQKFDAKTNRPAANFKAVPMTPDDEKRVAQPNLINVPASTPPTAPVPVEGNEGPIAGTVREVLEDAGVQVPKEGNRPADPALTNPTKVEDVKILGGDEADEVDQN